MDVLERPHVVADYHLNCLSRVKFRLCTSHLAGQGLCKQCWKRETAIGHGKGRLHRSAKYKIQV